ncbi:MAG: hypothetical protein QOF76_2724 [Solirubrobacteraceae bacterium]|nr:hypothetical protein [Solirubrobacteraceae bacterium]
MYRLVETEIRDSVDRNYPSVVKPLFAFGELQLHLLLL